MSDKTLNQEQSKNYDLVVNYLDIIFLAPETVNLLKTDKSFQEIIQKDINIISFYEERYNIGEKRANKFIQAYHVLTHEHVKISDDESQFSDDDALADDINYTAVYINNVLGKTIGDIDASLKANPNPQEANVKEESVETKESSDSDYTSTGTPQSDEEVLQRSGYTMHDVADQLIQNQAAMLLNRNIATGKVYAFQSKPIVIPIIKYLTAAAMFCILALSIAAFVLMMLTNGKFYMNVTTISSNGTNTSPQLVDLMTPFPFQLLMILLIVLMVIWSMIRNMKNDNVRYRYSWGWMIFYILMILMVTLIASGISNALIFNYESFQSEIASISQNTGTGGWYKVGETILNATASKAMDYVDDWRILQFVIYALTGLIIVFTVTGAVFNPKRDIQRMQDLLNQYAVEIRNGQISTDDLGGGLFPNGPFSGGLF